MSKILVKLNDSVLRVVEMDKDRLTIGRNVKNDIQIDNLAVSNFHARIDKSLGHYYIEDLESTNGTFINDRPITKWALNDNDAVTIGKHTLVFFLQGEGAGGAASALADREMDKTMILDTKAHRERLARGVGGGEPASRNEPLGVLTVLGAGAEEREFMLTDRLTLIGKDEGAGVRLDGLKGSAIGGFVARDGNMYTLIPPDSRNTMIVNGESVNEGVVLQEGDEIEVGGVKMNFHIRA